MKHFLTYLSLMICSGVSMAQDGTDSTGHSILSMVAMIVVAFVILFILLWAVNKFVKIKPKADKEGQDGWKSGGTYAGGPLAGATGNW